MGWLDGKKKEAGNEGEDQSKAQMTALVDAMSAKFEEQLKPIRETVATIQDKWQKLEGAASSESDEEARRKAAEAEAALSPEEKANLANNKLLAATILTNARITESEVLNEVSAQGLGEFAPKIREYFAGTPVQRKGQADYVDYCRNIVDMVVGKAARTNGLAFDGKSKRFFLEDASTRTTDGTSPFTRDMDWQDPRSGKVLTAADQLTKLGIDPKEYAEAVKKGAN